MRSARQRPISDPSAGCARTKSANCGNGRLTPCARLVETCPRRERPMDASGVASQRRRRMCKLSAQDFTVAMRWVRQICLPTWEVELEAAGNNGAIRRYLRALRGLLRRARWLGRLHKYA